MPVAGQLRSLLETGADAAVFHPSLQAIPIPSMGGGMGVVAAHPISPGATLARMPFSSMITVKKARYNLALAEVALEEGSSPVDTEPPPLSFVSSPVTEKTLASMTPTRAARLKERVARLERQLSGTDTMVCYLILMASLYGRWDSNSGCAQDRSAAATHNEEAPQASSVQRPRLRFRHESPWMGTWIRCLPPMYDNLLELGLRGGCAQRASLGEQQSREVWSHTALICGALVFPRHQVKVKEEHFEAWQRFELCLRTLRCLQSLPLGEPVGDPHEVGRSSAPGAVSWARACTMEQYLWAFNSLMSRGFAFTEDVWAMMPYVDYFNYALEANGTMYPLPSTSSHKRTALREGGKRSRLSHSSNGADRQDDVSSLFFSGEYEYLFKATRPIQAGEQVQLHYGAYSDFELLLWYGFTLSPYLRPAKPLLTADEDEAEPPTGSARPRRTPLSLILGQLQKEELRQRLFLEHKAAAEQGVSRSRRSIEEEGTADGDMEANVDVDDEEMSIWQRALQRAYSHVFTPLADTDGNYPTPSEGTSWLGSLMSTFATTHGEVAFAEEASAVHTWSLHLARNWCDNATSRDKLVTLKGLSTGQSGPAALGVLGPSSLMVDALRMLASYGTYGAFLGTQVDGMGERVAVLRALAWMELCSRKLAPAAACADEQGRHEEGWITSSSAVAMAAGLSTDVEALLRFLSIEATDAELRDYLAREPDY